MLILDLCGIGFHAVVVFGLWVRTFLFKSILGRCARRRREKVFDDDNLDFPFSFLAFFTSFRSLSQAPANCGMVFCEKFVKKKGNTPSIDQKIRDKMLGLEAQRFSYKKNDFNPVF